MKFEEWKAKAIAYICSLKYQDQETELHLQALTAKIEQARLETLYSTLRDIYLLSKKIPELKEIMPSPSEIENWFRE
ncbi:MAG: hypothetical protein ACPLYF_04605 [Fervidobacterium sp.]